MHRAHDPWVETFWRTVNRWVFRPVRLSVWGGSGGPVRLGSRAYMGVPFDRQRQIYEFVTMTQIRQNQDRTYCIVVRGKPFRHQYVATRRRG